MQDHATELRRRVWPRVEELCAQLDTTAIERDRVGGTPKAERDLIRNSGLLSLTIPSRFGGEAAPPSFLLEVVERFARVDPSVAHVFAFHHLMLATVRLFGSEAQWTEAYRSTAGERLFWGNALNPKDTRTRLLSEAEAFVVHGKKSFCSGALDSDRLIVSALDAHDKLVVVALPSDRKGIERLDDWDAIGQRQTDSGTVLLERVRVNPDEILRSPGPLGSVFASLRPCLAQAILVHVYLGIARGALEAARADASPSAATQSPSALLRWGELWVLLESADALAARARERLDRAFLRGDELTAEERGELAVAIAAAKVASTRAGLDISVRVFERLGARSALRARGLDRYFRNVRTHTLHDPVDTKLEELGAFALSRAIPTPSFYS